MDKSNLKRININYFDGLNAAVSSNLEKSTEFTHVENARCNLIGSIEKRQGSLNYDALSTGGNVEAINNYMLSYFNTGNDDVSLFRLSEKTVPGTADLYSFNSSTKKWTKYSQSYGSNGIDIDGTYNTDFDKTISEGCLFFTNLNDYPRYLDSSNLEVYEYHLDDPAYPHVNALGHLFNTPKCSRIRAYKNKLYISDYIYNGIRNKNSVLRSSPPMGIAALVNTDFDETLTAGVTVYGKEIKVTDVKYLSGSQGANKYDIYRGTLLVATLIVDSVTEDSIMTTITPVGDTTILAADEIWIEDTYQGKKVYRWISKTDSTGSTDAKVYDSFNLISNDGSETKMMETVGDVLMFASNNNLSSWNDSTLTNYDLSVGCVSRKGYVKSYGTLFFIHYTGIWSTTGGLPKLISGKIERYIKGATKLGKENCAAGKNGKSILFSIGDVTLYNTDGSEEKTLLDVVIEYNMSMDSWFIHTGIKATLFEAFVSSLNTDRLMFLNDDTNKPVSELFVETTDNGKEIPFRIDLTTMGLGFFNSGSSSIVSFEKISYPIDIIIEGERGSQASCFISLDGAPYYEVLGSIKKGATVLPIQAQDSDKSEWVRCRNIKISIRDNSKQICKISKVSLSYLPSNEEEEDKEDSQ